MELLLIMKKLITLKNKMFINIYLAFLKINTIRSLISFINAFFYLKIFRKKVKYYNIINSDISNTTLKSNLRIIDKAIELPFHPTAKYFLGIGINQGGGKSDMLLNPINAVLAAQLRSKNTLKVLSIGSRSYGELLNIRAQGFHWENIQGIDLFSINKKIIVGDMHSLKFADDSFDIIICGWVLAYSENREKAVSEMVRVLKPGGLISIGVSFLKGTNKEQIERRGYLIGSENRILNTDQILKYFKNNISSVYFRVEPVDNIMHSHMILTLSIKK